MKIRNLVDLFAILPEDKKIITDVFMKYVSILIFFFSVAALNVSGQNTLKSDNSHQSRLDSLVHENVLRYFSDTKAVGLSLGLVLRGKTHFYNYGETKAGNGKLPDNQTIYEIGSTTKSFTGILLAKAVLLQQGRNKSHPTLENIRRIARIIVLSS